MKNIYLTILISIFHLNAYSQSKKELKMIVENMKQDFIESQNDIIQLINQIDSLTTINDSQKKLIEHQKQLHHKIRKNIQEYKGDESIQYKPIIYIYPEYTREIKVKLNYDGVLTHTYPKYNNGWKVTANPDGTLFDAKSQEYYALYWEGKPNKDYTINEGFVVPGEQTIDFLENTLSKLGLNRKEANEFIIYWLPKMENNPYNLIHFSSTEYEEMAKLNITPKPETLIRVMMVFKPLDNSIKIKKQNLNSMSKKRKGFTVVEWGGHPLPKTHSIDL